VDVSQVTIHQSLDFSLRTYRTVERSDNYALDTLKTFCQICFEKVFLAGKIPVQVSLAHLRGQDDFRVSQWYMLIFIIYYA
jgi:hypothetical protein